MQRSSLRSSGPSAPKSVPSPGAVSAVGPAAAAPKPRIKNTRDYGKSEPPPEMGPSPNPFGTSGTSRLGGI